ncbi:MAG: SRPBCC family protein [Planctomycetota bacterium]|jgi:ligand-binding SRPBCC domain-containing protein|nr:SRPBCC family protein [Planctomycetota bacterium]
MRVHRLQRSEVLPIDLATAWAFFSDPRNLFTITPPDLNLVPVHEVPSTTHAGQIIVYTVRLAPLIRKTWVTEITHCEPPNVFVDEQRFGPYRFWHHRHGFTEVADGVRCDDEVHYAVPGGPLAGLIHKLMVRPQLERIFAYRSTALAERDWR